MDGTCHGWSFTIIALSTTAYQQSEPTKTPLKCVKQLLEYIAWQEPVVITYQKSGMVI